MILANTALLAAEGGEHAPPNPLLPQWYDVIWSLVAFVVVAFVFVKFVLPRFQQVMSERHDQIEGGIARAEAAQAEANKQLAAYQQQLSEARTEAAQIREEARVQGAQIVEDFKTKAQEESDRIVEQGHHQLAAQRQQVVAELRSDLGTNSINLAEKLLGSQLSDDVKRASTVDEFLTELDSTPASK